MRLRLRTKLNITGKQKKHKFPFRARIIPATVADEGLLLPIVLKQEFYNKFMLTFNSFRHRQPIIYLFPVTGTKFRWKEERQLFSCKYSLFILVMESLFNKDRTNNLMAITITNKLIILRSHQLKINPIKSTMTLFRTFL